MTAGSRLDEADSDGVAGEFEAVAQAQFLQEVGPVPLHGLGADDEQVPDLLRGVALRDELEDLLLAFGDGSGREGSPWRARSR